MMLLCVVIEPETTEIDTYLHTLSLHDALPISAFRRQRRPEQETHQDRRAAPPSEHALRARYVAPISGDDDPDGHEQDRAELDQQELLQIGRAHVCTPVTNAHLVCRLLLEKKNNQADE